MLTSLVHGDNHCAQQFPKAEAEAEAKAEAEAEVPAEQERNAVQRVVVLKNVNKFII